MSVKLAIIFIVKLLDHNASDLPWAQVGVCGDCGPRQWLTTSQPVYQSTRQPVPVFNGETLFCFRVNEKRVMFTVIKEDGDVMIKQKLKQSISSSHQTYLYQWSWKFTGKQEEIRNVAGSERGRAEVTGLLQSKQTGS